jgi:hypothetical protein
MIGRLGKQAAESGARMEMALESAGEETELEASAEELRAEETLRQLKQQMGMLGAPSQDAEEQEAEQDAEPAMEKTIGRVGK